MATNKYYYNPKTLTYEQLKHTPRKVISRTLLFLACSFLFALLMVLIIDSPKEKQLKRELSKVKSHYQELDQQVNQVLDVLADLQDRDDNIYRVIFETDPIPPSVRKAGVGGINRYADLEKYDNVELMKGTAEKLDQTMRQLYIQSKSYDEITKMVENKNGMLSAIPAIQPVANKDLKRMASGYGYRIDPYYKTRKFHSGMDFSAPSGTEIYATGKGVVEKVSRSRYALGNHIVINHGYGYKTVYGHMSKFNVRRGQKVQRGQVIGYVGNTGKSTAPHLHYEVRKNGKPINPINFYYNDLNPQEFETMLEFSSRHNQSFD